MKYLFKPIFLVTICLSLASCVSYQGSTYNVRAGDTLYSIAWRYGLDYKQLASWNRIAVNSIIKPGQELKLYQPNSVSTAPMAEGSSTAARTTTAKKTAKNTQATVTRVDTSKWLWPVNGTIMNTFSASKPDRRGIDIAGKLGQSVRATGDGKVVYSGNGLSGYGNLIIIKHNDTYLSAYAYCRKRFVNEGKQVKAGTIIAEMGQHNTKTARLHFEIRKNGLPVDPLNYLPKR